MGSWLPEYYFHNVWDVIYQKVFNCISSRGPTGERTQDFFFLASFAVPLVDVRNVLFSGKLIPDDLQ